jgi:multidrug efflux pump subunit AcrA (membrane-fusion protein)
MGAAWKIGAGALVLAAGAIVTGMAVSGSQDEQGDAPEDTEAPAQTAEVVRRDLAQVEELDGTIDFGDARPLVVTAEGMITAVPSVGDVIANGERVLEVDGNPVIALQGAFPFWRPLNNAMTDGKDVAQLELMLAARGYAEEYEVTVDEEFTWNTEQALDALQEDHGLDDDGELSLSEVIVITEPVRIDSIGGLPGQPASAAAIEVTDAERTVQVGVGVSDAHLANLGDELQVELPNGDVVPGTVVDIGAAVTDSEGTATVPLSLTVDGARGLADATPVDVRLVVEQVENVLAVPVESVLALAEGGYAVEVVGSAGSSSTLIAVELGMFADGWVEITGDIEAGTKVVMP